jgi:hypothetical protein
VLLLIFAPQPAAPSAEYINFVVVLGDLYPRLNATSQADAVYWTDAELYQWFDEATQRLARSAGVFVERDTSITVSSAQGSYDLPSDQISTIQADLAGVVLRPRTVEELEALDADWPATTGPPSPSAFVQNVLGLGVIALYPAPGTADNEKTLGLVIHTAPATVSASNALLSAPSVLQDYFGFYALAEARAKESKGAMPEVADWLRSGVTALYEQVIEGYWGEAM